MGYCTKTQSNTPPGRYHVPEKLSHRKILGRKQTEDRQQKPNHPMPWAPPKGPFSRSWFLSLIVDCAVGFNCLDFQLTAPPKVTHSLVVSRSVLWWDVHFNLQYLSCTVSKVLLQPAGASLIPIRSLSVSIMRSSVSVEIGDASLWRCGLPLDKPSGRWLFPIETQGLIAGCMVADARIVQYVSVSCQHWHYMLYIGVLKLETLLHGNVTFRSTNKV